MKVSECTLNMTEFVLPVLQKVHSLVLSEPVICSEEFKRDSGFVKSWWTEHGIEIFIPEEKVRLSSDMYIVTEASARIADNLTPVDLRTILGYYEQRVLWCGFNMEDRLTGSKGVAGDYDGLVTLIKILQRLLKFHIDQTYKSLVGSALFALAQRNHICFGVLPHRSGCCNTSRHTKQPMSDREFVPTPAIPDRLHYVKESKKNPTVEEVLWRFVLAFRFGVSSWRFVSVLRPGSLSRRFVSALRASFFFRRFVLAFRRDVPLHFVLRRFPFTLTLTCILTPSFTFRCTFTFTFTLTP